jgi:hypothetical protein
MLSDNYDLFMKQLIQRGCLKIENKISMRDSFFFIQKNKKWLQTKPFFSV